MQIKDDIDGIEVIMDDGDETTDHIVELHGKFRDEAECDRINKLMKDVKQLGWTIKVDTKEGDEIMNWYLKHRSKDEKEGRLGTI